MAKRSKSGPKNQPSLLSDTTDPLTGFRASPAQQAIFEWIVRSTSPAARVKSVAGSGKTTTLVEGARLISDNALFCAFNKHIAETLAERLKGTSFVARTIHQVGYGILAKALAGKLTVNERKYQKLAKQWVNEQFPVHGIIQPEQKAERLSYALDLASLTDFVRMTRTPLDDRAMIKKVALQYGLDLRDLMILGVKQLIEWGAQEAERTRTVDFTDMVWLPLYLKLPLPKYPWVFVDEAQDLNVGQRDLVLGLLAEGGRILFCGDGNQAIMGFAGADFHSFESIKTITNAEDFPLSVCYRCGIEHIALAQEIVPEIEPAPNAIQGEVITMAESLLGDVVQAGDLILCRVTAPLIGWCLKLIEKKIPAKVRGRDVANDLINLAEKLGAGFTEAAEYKTRFLIALRIYEKTQQTLLEEREAPESAMLLHQDRCAALQSCYEGFPECQTVEELCDQIRNLFADEGTFVWFSTVHRAKGDQARRVFILYPHKLPLLHENQTDDEQQQEWNLYYVAVTRPTNTLVFLERPETIHDGSAARRAARYPTWTDQTASRPA